MVTTELDTDRGPGLTQLVSGIVRDTEDLVAQQIKLVKVEIKNDAHRVAAASIPGVAGAGVCLIGAFIVAIALAQLLLAIWPALPAWGAYGIVGITACLAGVLAVRSCIHQIASVIPPLEQSAAGVKENIQWKTKS